MMKKAPCIEARRHRRSQRGDALFEALIGLVIMVVLGLGLSYAAARVLYNQRFASTQGIALQQMRGALETTGIQNLCNGSAATLSITPTGGSAQVVQMPAPSCNRDAVTVGVAADASLQATLTSSGTSVVTRMVFSTPTDDSTAKGLLGAGAMTLSQ